MYAPERKRTMNSRWVRATPTTKATAAPSRALKNVS
jgi:hypothetical protein